MVHRLPAVKRRRSGSGRRRLARPPRPSATGRSRRGRAASSQSVSEPRQPAPNPSLWEWSPRPLARRTSRSAMPHLPQARVQRWAPLQILRLAITPAQRALRATPSRWGRAQPPRPTTRLRLARVPVQRVGRVPRLSVARAPPRDRTRWHSGPRRPPWDPRRSPWVALRRPTMPMTRQWVRTRLRGFQAA